MRVRGPLLIAVLLVAVAAGVAAAVVHFGGSKNTSSSNASGAAPPPPTATTGCLNDSQARAIWNDLNGRLDALVLHPDLNKIADVAQGTAATDMRQYIQQKLLDHKLTEREHERLDSLSIVQAGCNGQPVTLRVTETLVQDDYLAADGHIDHQDPAVGSASHLLESFARSGSTWKVTSIASLDQTPDPGTTV
jgi:hypothetical protein